MNWKKGIKKIKNKLEDMLKQINEEDMKKSNDYINNQEEIKKILNNFV